MTLRIRKSRREMLLGSKRMLDGLAALTGKPRLEFISNIPDAPKLRAPRKVNTHSERLILAAILKYLRSHYLIATCWRMQSGVFGDGERIMRVGVIGMPDILGMLVGGRLFAIEVKSDVGQLTSAQSAMLQKIRAGGGLVCTARSIEDARAMIEGA